MEEQTEVQQLVLQAEHLHIPIYGHLEELLQIRARYQPEHILVQSPTTMDVLHYNQQLSHNRVDLV
jgi:hypothetical protein